MSIGLVYTSVGLKIVGWLLMVHVTVGTGPPNEVQKMLVLPPSTTITVALVPAALLEFAKCAITIKLVLYKLAGYIAVLI